MASSGEPPRWDSEDRLRFKGWLRHLQTGAKGGAEVSAPWLLHFSNCAVFITCFLHRAVKRAKELMHVGELSQQITLLCHDYYSLDVQGDTS